MNELQSKISDLSTAFAQAVTRVVMETFAQAVPRIEAPAAPGRPTRATAAPAPARPIAARVPVRRAPPPSPRAGHPAPRSAASTAAPTPRAAARADGPVLRASLPSAATLELVASIVKVLANGPLYSEDLRRELNLSRSALAKPLAEALASGKVIKTGERRKTIYQVALGSS